MTQNEVRVGWKGLHEFTREAFVHLGLPPEDAETEADVLIWANLRGVDSHGVLRIPVYAEWLADGRMNPKPNIQIINETPAAVVIDADNAMGPVVTKMAMLKVMDKARGVGIGWGLLRNTTHQGAMGYYALMAAEAGMAGMAVVCSPPNMAPHGARVAGVHNSPIAIAVPGKRRGPLILDMATSVVAGGKLSLAIDRGASIPEGWALDKDGNPTTDPAQNAALVPFGGPKGSGLAMMFECLSSLMVGNPLLSPVLLGAETRPQGVQNSFLAAIDIGTFTDVEAYKEHVDDLVEGIKGLPRAEGTDEIFLPGEPELRVYDDRVKNGIPLPGGTVRNLKDVALRFEIPFPAGM